MTWGKMVPLWTRDPARALSTLIDLNHRYALMAVIRTAMEASSGASAASIAPSSLRDRSSEPFAPAIQGPTASVWTSRRRGLHGPPGPRCAATRCSDRRGHGGSDRGQDARRPPLAGRAVRQGRRAGGALRSAHPGQRPTPFDHGGVAFGVNDPRFARYTDAWTDAGFAASRRHKRYAIDIAGLIDHLAEDLDVACGTRIERLEHDGSADAGSRGRHPLRALRRARSEHASCSGERPAAQVTPELAATLEAIPMTAGWTVMTTAVSDLPWLTSVDGNIAEVINGRASHPASRRMYHGSCLHALLGRAYRCNARGRRRSARARARSCARHTGGPEAVRAHRWRYARAAPAPEVQTWHPEYALPCAATGPADMPRTTDHGAPGVEAAFLSGAAAAGRSPRFEAARSSAAPARPLAQDDLFA